MVLALEAHKPDSVYATISLCSIFAPRSCWPKIVIKSIGEQPKVRSWIAPGGIARFTLLPCLAV